MSTHHILSQHTPRPWIYAVNDFGGHEIGLAPAVPGSGGGTSGYRGIAECTDYFRVTLASHAPEADGALVSAAPDLLECLIHLVDRDWFRDGSSGQVVCCLDADQVRAALTKALSLSAPEVTTPVETQSELLTVKNETRVGFLPCYQVGETINGEFGFKTPVGRCDGFLTRADAERAAASEYRANVSEAETGTGPIAAVLRKYFAEADGKEVA